MPMRYLTTMVDSELWISFVNEIAKRNRLRHGIQEALEEAIDLWIKGDAHGKRAPRQNA